MTQLVSVTNDVRQTFTTIVGSQNIRLGIYFLNDEDGSSADGWFCDFTLLSQTPKIITTGQRLVSKQAIAPKILSDFVGQLIIVPITNPTQDLISSSAWGVTHQLVYFTAQEVIEFLGNQIG
ncbi:MAG: hypothetical protein V3V61_01270 [Gammaproteobacteria bacterium]